ncbi:MAG: hypothetical protein ACFB0E_16660 [Leptolyngbyaceae cyanobacterium]
MDKIKGQASKVGELLFDRETGATYKKTVTLTWAILRETGVLLWLVICLVFVGGEWFWYKSIALGRSSRNWYEELKAPSEAEPKSASDIGESALTALGTGAGTLLYQAKKQLGMDAAPPAPRAPASAAKPAAAVAAEPAQPATAATATTAPANPEPVAAPSVTFEAEPTTVSPEVEADTGIATDPDISA